MLTSDFHGNSESDLINIQGSHVLNSFKDNTAASGKNVVDFGEVVKGQKGAEVARFFLSTLMLANTENVKIGTKAGTDPQLGKSCLFEYVNNHSPPPQQAWTMWSSAS